jgi:hypothetical protein
MCLDIAASFPITWVPVWNLLDMSSQDIYDIEKTAGLDFISPAETICDAGQSTQDANFAKLPVSRGMGCFL